MSRPRFILQPGLPLQPRIVATSGTGRAFSMGLTAGAPLLDQVAQGFAEAGYSSGVAEFSGLALGPLAYVMPALSTTPTHAAYYSEVFRPGGVSRVSRGALTFGRMRSAAKANI